MRRPATNILLLAICCFWFYVQPTAGDNKQCGKTIIDKCGVGNDICIKHYTHICAGGVSKKSDINDLTQANDLRAELEGHEMQEAKRGERKEGGKESGASRRDRSDDLKSEISDLRQLLEDKQLLDIANRRHSPSSAPRDSTLGRLMRSLHRTTTAQVEDQEDEKAEEYEEQDTNTDRRYSIKYTLTMLRKILDDIQSRLESQPVSDSSE